MLGLKVSEYKQLLMKLKGEKIDIVRWSEDPIEFVANALSPSKVVEVLVNEEEKATTVIVPDYQLSLAIGKRGQNARLAAKLTGWKIDIKSESDAEKAGIYPLNSADKDEKFDDEPLLTSIHEPEVSE